MDVSVQFLYYFMIMDSFRHFYSPPVLVQKGLIIKGIGHYEWMKPGYVLRPHGTDDYLFMYFHQETRISALRESVEHLPMHPPGSAILWEPGTAQYYGRRTTRWCHSWIHFEGSLAEGMLRRDGVGCNGVFPFPDAGPMHVLLRMLFQEMKRGQLDTEAVTSLFRVLTRYLDRAAHTSTNPLSIPQAYLEVKHLLETGLEMSYNLQDLALRVHHSPAYFSEKFKTYFGMSPIHYALEQRLQHACYLLRDRNLTVSDVAERVGFEDLFYFSKRFKKRFSLSPSQYRKQNRLSPEDRERRFHRGPGSSA